MKPTAVNARAFVTQLFENRKNCGMRCALSALFFAALIGCRSPVQREVYSQRMSGEIRVLEDQLYDADYQNRVLRDELKRVKASCEPTATTRSLRQTVPRQPAVNDSQQPAVNDYGPAITSDPMALTDQPGEIIHDNYPQPTNPGESISDGQPYSSELSPRSVPYVNPSPYAEIDQIESSGRESSTNPELLPVPKFQSNNASEENGVLPPPAVPEPPGNDTFKAPSIQPGSKVSPPPLPGSPEDVPDGRVKLPDGIDASLNYSSPSLPEPVRPDHIQLHPSLSSAHQFDQDDAADGLWVVVNVVDADGRILSLKDIDIDASMTIVALDPAQEASVARIGRWDFSAEEVKTFVRSMPVDGLHVPIKWQDAEPSGEEVIVHVRLQSEGEEMRCQGNLQLKSAAAMAKWLPRGSSPAQR